MPDVPGADRAHPPGYRNGRLHFHDPRHAVLVTDFDVADYTDNARGRIDVAIDAVHLDEQHRPALELCWRLEAGALGDMRRMLASWTGKEARITAFLATWAYERHWNARALRDLLEAGGRPRPATAHPQGLRTHLRHRYVEHLLPSVAAVSGMVVGEPATAGHMARMAVHEGALRVALRALEPRLDGVARDTVSEVIARRNAFVTYFREEATARIQRSAPERLSARFALGPWWSPFRIDDVPDPAEVAVLSSLFADESARAELAESDGVVGDLLPGRPAPSLSAVSTARARARSADGL